MWQTSPSRHGGSWRGRHICWIMHSRAGRGLVDKKTSWREGLRGRTRKRTGRRAGERKKSWREVILKLFQVWLLWILFLFINILFRLFFWVFFGFYLSFGCDYKILYVVLLILDWLQTSHWFVLLLLSV